jgi:hypothetical protein
MKVFNANSVENDQIAKISRCHCSSVFSIIPRDESPQGEATGFKGSFLNNQSCDFSE